MVQDHNLHEEMNRFFVSLPYQLLVGEGIELRYLDLDGRAPHTEFFSDLEAAARKAASLGPARPMFLSTAPPATAAKGEARKSRLLALWMPVGWRDRLLEDFIFRLEDEPCAVWAEVRFLHLEKGPVVVTARYLYADRCRVPGRVLREAESLSDQGATKESGWHGHL